MGTARNMAVFNVNAAGDPTGQIRNTYHLPGYDGISSIPENRMLWKKVFAPSIDHVYNYLGTPLVPTPNDESLNIDLVDLCGFVLSPLTPMPLTGNITASGMPFSYPANYVEARVYSCLDHRLHWYSNGYQNCLTYTSSGVTGSGVYSYVRKMEESFLQANGLNTPQFVGWAKSQDAIASLSSTGMAIGYYTSTLMDLTNLQTKSVILPISKGQGKILLPATEYASKSTSNGVPKTGVDYVFAGSDLTAQQKNPSIDLSDTNVSKLYSTSISPQRSMLLTLNQYFEDPLYLLTANYCPLSAGQFGYIPRDTTNTGRVGTYATIPFSNYMTAYSQTNNGPQLRNGLIYGNPFMNNTWLGSMLVAAGINNNVPSLPSYPRIGTTFPSIYRQGAPIESVDAGVEYVLTSATGSVGDPFTKYYNPSGASGDIQKAVS